ncbi:MAG: hypothetical protein IKS45_01230, partial [Thermoguttaceae bacterium]|nr:hypothetical protein [Thermoguttaceae bacterium]
RYLLLHHNHAAFPGLGCTEDLFVLQKQALSDVVDVVVPKWIEPEKGETLKGFALRWAEEVYKQYFDPESGAAENACYVGGLSFGGMVSPIIGGYLAERGVDVKGCFLLASIRGGTEIPPVSRAIWKFSCWMPNGNWDLVKLWARYQIWIRGKRITFLAQNILNQLIDSPVKRSYYVLKMICAWRDKPEDYQFPIWHLHGSADRLLPVRYTHPDEIVKGAGHVLALLCPEEVNRFIRQRISGGVN